ncbi:MAG: hypothetical protein WBF04_14800 [Candidatus Sulfotelmatobacter sp.]
MSTLTNQRPLRLHSQSVTGFLSNPAICSGLMDIGTSLVPVSFVLPDEATALA